MFVWLALLLLVLLAPLVGLALVRRWYRTPQRPHRHEPAELGIAFEAIRFPTANQCSLYGWFLPAGEARATLVLVHGWGRNVERLLPFVGELHRAGYALLAFDARSHGSSDRDGLGNMVKFSVDLRAALDEALRQGADPERLGALGLSVGGAAAIHLAAEDPRLGAVLTIGAFADPGEMTALDLGRRGIPRLLVPLVLRYVERRVGFRFAEVAPERRIRRVAAPILLVHGEDDAVVPLAHARRLAAAAPAAELLVLPGRGHSDCDRDPAFWPRVLSFLGAAFAG